MIRYLAMRLRRFIQAFGYTGYDRRGELKVLVGRKQSSASTDIDGVSVEVRDEALEILCDSFDIPKTQQYMLRLEDTLAFLYKAMVGPKWGDDMEYERLALALDALPGAVVASDEFQAIKTVADLIRFVAQRRGIDSDSSGPTGSLE